ncbi:MAG: glycoside hydrolase domain-containing protein [Nocardioidaceae bacterium]
MHRIRNLTIAAALACAATVGVLEADRAESATPAMPGSITGYAFDACQTPDQASMDAWREDSPYSAVGVYLAGVNRLCKDQPNLTADWVAAQAGKGWRVLPLTVGLQASCSHFADDRRIDPTRTDSYLAARKQGRAEARSTVAAATDVGIGRASTLWFDLEDFDLGDTRCRQSALSFLSAWTTTLHDLGYRSGVYSSAASGIKALDYARTTAPDAYAMPDQIWFAHWNGEEDVRSTQFSADGWTPHRRIHQYASTHLETYGDVGLQVDSSFMDVGHGSVAPKPDGHCGVRVDFGSYRLQQRGDRGAQVAAAQCLLRHERAYDGPVSGRFTPATVAAVKTFQGNHPPLGVTGGVNAKTWTALLSQGSTPLMKYGTASNAVRRLQRALNAAGGEGLAVTGVFEGKVRAATQRYQRAHGLDDTGVVTDDLWAALQTGTV